MIGACKGIVWFEDDEMSFQGINVCLKAVGKNKII